MMHNTFVSRYLTQQRAIALVARRRHASTVTAVTWCRQSFVSALNRDNHNNKPPLEARHLTPSSSHHAWSTTLSCQPCGGTTIHDPPLATCAAPRSAAKRAQTPPPPTTRRYFSTTTKYDEDKDADNTNHQSEQSSSPTVQVTSNNDTISLEIPGTGKTGTGRTLALVFTCTVCETRAAKQFTENAYLNGVVLIRCPGCQNLHLIADRLGWFDDTDGKHFDLTTLEQMTGQKVQRIGGENGTTSVWELSLEDLIGKDKMQQILEHQRQEKQDENKEETKSP